MYSTDSNVEVLRGVIWNGWQTVNWSLQFLEDAVNPDKLMMSNGDHRAICRYLEIWSKHIDIRTRLETSACNWSVLRWLILLFIYITIVIPVLKNTIGSHVAIDIRAGEILAFYH